MTIPRRTLIDINSTPYYHCIARCVRRAFLCGVDSLTGNNYEHRKPWVVDRLKKLAGIFAIEVCPYAVMSNHYHVVLHIDTKTGERWSDREVCQRWTQLFVGPLLVQRFLSGDALDKTQRQRVTKYAKTYRQCLLDISWFMRCLNEYLARRANAEDDCKGRFWEGRFKSQALLDEAAVLSCMAYVDLNPVRAGLVDRPEASDFTSIQERIRQWQKNRNQQTWLKPLKRKRSSARTVSHLLCLIILSSSTGQVVPSERIKEAQLILICQQFFIDWVSMRMNGSKPCDRTATGLYGVLAERRHFRSMPRRFVNAGCTGWE